jgi:hypothetical protein
LVFVFVPAANRVLRPAGPLDCGAPHGYFAIYYQQLATYQILHNRLETIGRRLPGFLFSRSLERRSKRKRPRKPAPHAPSSS